MATHTQPTPHRPLLDPDQLEQAGRALRLWLDRVFGRIAAAGDTSIAWEDGEPSGDRPDHAAPER